MKNVHNIMIGFLMVLGIVLVVPMYHCEIYELNASVEYINRRNNFISVMCENGRKISLYYDARVLHNDCDCIIKINGHGTKWTFDDEIVSVEEIY